MSDAVTALRGAAYSGEIRIADAGLTGMLTIRGDLTDDTVAAAVERATGCGVPGTTTLSSGDMRHLLWMSPDELLLILPYGDVDKVAQTLSAALDGHHHLIADVSDARAVFDLTGDGGAIRDVLAKLTPADVSTTGLPVGRVRRTRVAQVPAALWFDSETAARLVCFRSVAEYVLGLLSVSAAPGSAPGYFRSPT